MVTLSTLERSLLETANGLLCASHEDAVARDCAHRLALDTYATILDLRIKAVQSGLAEMIDEEEVERRKTREEKGRN